MGRGGCPLLSVCAVPNDPSLALQETWAASVLWVRPMEGHVSLAAVGVGQAMGGSYPPDISSSPTSLYFSFLGSISISPSDGRVRFLSVLSVPAAQIGLRRGDARAAELGHVDGCQVPGSTTSKSHALHSPLRPLRDAPETSAYKSCHDRSPGNFLCCWQLHTHAFPFSCENSIPSSNSTHRPVIATLLHTDPAFSGRYFQA